jgi:cyclomaltodextrinase
MRRFLPLLFLCLGPAQAQAFSAPDWALKAPLYEVNLEMFSKEGTYKALERRLPEIKALGVGILWLMPITTRGELKAFGSPYCVRDYRGLHGPFGSAQDLKDLVGAAHALGLHLILDWVGNHSSWDNSLVTQHPEYYQKDSKGAITQAYTWGDVAQLDYGNEGLRAYMIESMKYWVETYGVDGFRCDVAWGIPMEFWVDARAELEKIRPVFMLAEADDAGDQAAFDANYDWAIMNSGKSNPLTDIAQGLKPASLIAEQLRQESLHYARPFMRMRFTTNHDEWKDNGTTFERLGEGLRAFSVMDATLPGKPLIYNGQEIGWRAQKGPIDWKEDKRAEGFRSFYTRLFTDFQSKPALYAGSLRPLANSAPDSVCSYLRQSGTAQVRVLLNLSSRPVSFSAEGGKGAYSLKAWDYLIEEGKP